MFEPLLFENFADLDRTFSVFDQMRRRMDAVLRESERSTLEPRFTLDDRGDAYVLEAELPGVTTDDLEITLTGSTLRMRAQRRVELPDGSVAHRRERPSFELSRSITLPTRINGDDVTAEAKDGIVTLILPKAAEARPRAIEVKSA